MKLQITKNLLILIHDAENVVERVSWIDKHTSWKCRLVGVNVRGYFIGFLTE